MIKLYNDNDLKIIARKKGITLLFLILSFVLFAAGMFLFLLLATYKTRMTFIVISSIVETICFIFGLFFIFKFNYLRRMYIEYETLLNSKYEQVHCEILECSSFITTLPDRSHCHELLVKEQGDKEVIYYLSEIFDYRDLKEGKAIILVASDYVVGYSYED